MANTPASARAPALREQRLGLLRRRGPAPCSRPSRSTDCGRQPEMAHHRNLGVEDGADRRRPACAPPSSLTASAPVSAHQARRVAQGILGAEVVGHPGHVHDQQRPAACAPDGPAVVDHLVQGDRQRALVAQHDVAQRIADEHRVDAAASAASVAGDVVGGQHHQRGPRPCACETRERSSRFVGCGHLRPPSSPRRRPECRGRGNGQPNRAVSPRG